MVIKENYLKIQYRGQLVVILKAIKYEKTLFLFDLP